MSSSGSDASLVELALAVAGRCAGAGASNEAAYRRLWDAHAASCTPPGAMACAGGVCADRLPWIFQAGYQAAVRSAFGLDSAGWIAFVASEDRSEEDPLPGVSITHEQGVEQLNGYKTWVAGVDHVDELVVLVGPRQQARLFRIERGRSGLSLTRKPDGGFLAELSQGRARFEAVRLGAEDELAAPELSDFPLHEARNIYAAFGAFLATRDWLSGGAEEVELLLGTVQQLEALAPSTPEAVSLLKSADDEVQRLSTLIEAQAAESVPGWDRDRRLLAMYSRGIQRR